MFRAFRVRLISLFSAAVALFCLGVGGASNALADTEYLPLGRSTSCTATSFADSGNWVRYKLNITTTTTITSATALVVRVPTGSNSLVLEVLATNGSTDPLSATLMGTLSQSSYAVNGSQYTATLTGSIDVTPGSYWFTAKSVGMAFPEQGLCTSLDIETQSPWSYDRTQPYGYVTRDGGTSYISSSATPRMPFVTMSGIPTVSSSSTGSAPAPVIQEFGKPLIGSCGEAQPDGLNWANVSSGGWGESWSQWMNGGTGGFVCTRTLIYSMSRSAWMVS